MLSKRRRLIILAILGLLAGGALAAILVVRRALAPLSPGAPEGYVRYNQPKPLNVVLHELAAKKILQNPGVARFYAIFTRHRTTVAAGTYRVGAGMSGQRILAELNRPVHQNVVMPSTFWAARTAALLAKKDVCTADDFMRLVKNPAQFQSLVSFPLPKDSLEGYLFADTYDLPPLLGAEGVITRQLKAFDRKVAQGVADPSQLGRAVIVGSLIELEVNRNDERPLVASVIENRLKRHMRLQIDASVNYAYGVWHRRLTFKDLKNAPGPYNLYRHDGLPPGPICSPSSKSIFAALHPAKTDYLYYVALPSGKTLFAATYAQHLANIKRRKAALDLIPPPAKLASRPGAANP